MKKERKKPERAQKKKAPLKKAQAGPMIKGKAERPLRVLILEDNPADAELMERRLRRDRIAFTARRAATRAAFCKALGSFKPDLVLADYTLPDFDAMSALALARKAFPFLPFIAVTGSIGEEKAVAVLRAGADDYLLKDRLARLGEAVQHAMENRRLQMAKETAELTLKRSEEDFQDIFQTVKDGLAYADLQGKILSVNPALEKILQMPGRELVGKNFLDLTRKHLSKENAKKTLPFLAKLIRGVESDGFQVEYQGKILDIRTTVNRKSERLTGVVRDITENRKFADALQAAAQRWRATFDSMNDAVCLLDEKGAIRQCNRAMNRLLGLPYKKIIGQDCLKLVCGVRKRASCAFTQALRDGKRHEEETFWRDRRYQVAVDPIVDAEQVVHGVVHVMSDITAARAAENRLRESAAKLSRAQRVGKLGSWDWDLEGNALEWSDELYRIWGVSKEFPLTFEGIAAMIHPEDQAGNLDMTQRLLSAENKGDHEFRILCPDGTVKHIHQHVEVTRAPSGRAVKMFGVMQDISQRKHAEKALREMSEIFRLFLKHNPIYVFIKDQEIRPIYLSDNYETMLDRPIKEILGKSMSELFPSELSRSMVEDDKTILRDGVRREFIEELNGRIYSTLKFPILIDGKPKYLAGYTTDITERKQAEEKLQASLREKEVLLKEIHHRVKNNLQVVSGLLSLQAAHIDDERLLRVIRESQSRIWTMALIHQTLYQSGNLASIDMGDYIRNLTGNLLSAHAQAAMPPSIRYDLEPLQLVIDKAIPLALIVNELATNAIKHAFPDGRPGEIRISLHECRDTARRAPNEETNGQYEKGTARRAPTFELTIADNGIGLPAGFDAKNQKSLGLQLASMLTGQLQGAMAIEAGAGTSVRITFATHEQNKKNR